MGRYYEQLAAAGELVTDARTITEADIAAFAALTGDRSAIHLDEAYARTTRFGRPIAHGALVFSISIGLTTSTGVLEGTLIAFAGLDRLRFVRPVFIGDTVTVRKRVVETRELDEAQGVVTFETKVINQGDETVLVYLDKHLIRRQPGDPRP